MAAQPWGPQGGPAPPYPGAPNHDAPPVTVPGGQSTVVVVQRGPGNCPNCGTGLISPEFTCCGIVIAILFFPIGLCCCYMMRERKCGSCGFVSG